MISITGFKGKKFNFAQFRANDLFYGGNDAIKEISFDEPDYLYMFG